MKHPLSRQAKGRLLCLSNENFFLILWASTLTGCASITLRHDFLVPLDSSERLCGEHGSRQNATLVQSPKTNFVVQAKSIGGLYMTGPFFAPIFPWEPLNSKANVIRVYSSTAFSVDERKDFKNWEIESENSIQKPSAVEFKEEAGAVGNFNYSHIAEFSFQRPRWASDFTLSVKSSGVAKRLRFSGRPKWDYQWMGNEDPDPKCLAR